jgi:hypothetical protein
MTNSIRAFLLSFLIAASAFAGSGKTPNSFILGTDFGVKTGFTLNTIITAIGSSEVKVILDGGQWDVDVNVTIPANITLSLPPGSFIDLGIAKTVTFSGGSLEAPQTTIFVGGGSVVGTVKSLADWTGDWGSAVVLATYTLTHIQQLTGSSIVSNTITSLEILDRTIQDIDIAIGGVNSSNILDRTIQDIDIAIGGVNSSNILEGTITSNDIALATIGTNLLNSEVTSLLNAESSQALLNEDYSLYKWGLPSVTISPLQASWDSENEADHGFDTTLDMPSTMFDGDVTTHYPDATTNTYIDANGQQAISYDFGEVYSGVFEIWYKWKLDDALDSGESVHMMATGSHHPQLLRNSYIQRDQDMLTLRGAAQTTFVTNTYAEVFTGRYLNILVHGAIGGETFTYKIQEILVWATNSAYANLGGLNP